MILYYLFFKIGLFAFGGGYATLPLIETNIVNNYGYISEDTFNNMVILSQMTPGPIALNAATFIGTMVSGFYGAIFATLGVITPQIILLCLCIKYINLNNKYVKKGIYGINIAIILFMIKLLIKMSKPVFSMNLLVGSIAILTIALVIKKVSIIKIILLNILFTTILIIIGVI